MKLNIQDTFTTELPADPNSENATRQVEQACFSYVNPKQTAKPELLHFSEEMLDSIGLTKEDASSKEFLNVFTGNSILENTKPYAMCYGGHQFGNWAGQLGDGRAINLTEIVHNNKRWSLQLKGAGKTPYSRSGDGLAVLRSSVREYLCSEAMYHLGVPTTRALSLSITGDQVLRDVLYNGNSAYEKGAVVCRTAPSFLRFGNYELFTQRHDFENLKTTVDYTIRHFYKHLGEPSKETYISFFKEVAEKTMKMILDWQRVGFVHGVMNTDNLSILGLTIDFGPYGWLEGYDHNWTPNTTDAQNKRYRYGQQLTIGLWNLLQLANALYPLIDEAEGLEKVLHAYHTNSDIEYFKMMNSKIGLSVFDEGDTLLIKKLEENLQLIETDMTIFFRNLSNFKVENKEDGLKFIEEAFYTLDALTDPIKKQWNDWFDSYAERLKIERYTDSERKEKMNAINPKYVLRNYMSQLAIDAADKGDYTLIDELYQLLKNPYAEQLENEKWFAKRPEWARNKVGCSMLSCSS